ncbi:hypothetical protein P154DRAFT_532043 [Amniculicola lignicola CBS 123094]|uniref:Uncharacterized protein n=1 Tax=Amniculicola lignicola CBS 123094 TaxID=1392246 RepID=A0A6A5WS97_9PLEO|nr:hypothetical protein P154DRAFT_532043 [Amniculicola lignicola CBS 123094]
MCHTEHVFHLKCRHWGRERFSGDPCIRSRIVDGRHTGCGYIESLGSVNSDDFCHRCKYRETIGNHWTPFAQVSNGGLAKIEEKRRQRSLVLEALHPPLDCRHRWFHQWKAIWRPPRNQARFLI